MKTASSAPFVSKAAAESSSLLLGGGSRLTGVWNAPVVVEEDGMRGELAGRGTADASGSGVKDAEGAAGGRAATAAPRFDAGVAASPLPLPPPTTPFVGDGRRTGVEEPRLLLRRAGGGGMAEAGGSTAGLALFVAVEERLEEPGRLGGPGRTAIVSSTGVVTALLLPETAAAAALPFSLASRCALVMRLILMRRMPVVMASRSSAGVAASFPAPALPFVAVVDDAPAFCAADDVAALVGSAVLAESLRGPAVGRIFLTGREVVLVAVDADVAAAGPDFGGGASLTAVDDDSVRMLCDEPGRAELDSDADAVRGGEGMSSAPSEVTVEAVLFLRPGCLAFLPLVGAGWAVVRVVACEDWGQNLFNIHAKVTIGQRKKKLSILPCLPA